MEKVILAFEGEKTTARVRDILESSGTAGCLICHSAAEVKRLVNKQHVSVVICGYKLRDETAEALCEDLPFTCSVLVLAVQNLLDMIESEDVFKLVAPVSRSDLLSSVRMLTQMGRRIERFTRPKHSEEEKALIGKAKALLMDRNGMTEEQAHRFLQTKSMHSGTKLLQTAQMVLDGTWID